MSAPNHFLVSLHQENLQRAIDFLKFAEAKNGAAIAFASALVLTALQFREKLSNFSFLELLGITFALSAGLVSARSFVPRLSGKSANKNQDPKKPNLLFFSDVAEMSAKDFQEDFLELANSEIELIHEYSVQTVANSQIAKSKMDHFTIAALLLIAGMILTTSGIVFEIFSRI